MSALWSRLPFIGRLLVTASIALLVAGAAMLFVSARQEAEEARADLRSELDKELAIMPTALVDTVVIGDFATLQQTLDRYVARPLIAAAGFRDLKGAHLHSEDTPLPSAAPAWFVALFDFTDVEGRAPVVVGGRNYGELYVSLTAKGLSNRAWNRLKSHMAILLLAVALDFIGIWAVLRTGLRPLKALEEGTRALAAGNLDVRLVPEGSTELRSVIESFNSMAEAVRRSQRALQQSEERLQLAINGVNDGIWDWNLRTGEIYLSPKWKEMVGYAAEELADDSATIDALLHPDDRVVVQQARERYINGETTTFQVEFRFRHKNGSWRWILGRGEALRDADGVPYRMAGSHTDITDRKLLQETLRSKMLELNTILDNSSVGITYVKDRRQIWANTRMAELFGYSPAEMENQSTRLFFTSQAAYEELGQQAYPVLATGERYTTEIEMRHKDGHSIWMRLSGKSISSKESGDGSIWVFEEITAQKRVEAELRAAKEAADAANQAKSRFLATMSHEIRTPMNGIFGMAQLLLQPDVEEAEREDYARTILNSGQTLLTLLNDILDLSKVEAGRVELESTVFEPQQITHETGALFAETAANKGLRLDSDWQGPPGQRYRGDPLRLRQMLVNLASNALKFTDRGYIRITAREMERDGDTAHLEFAVADSGIGIPADKQELLFQPFSQADSSTTRRFGGTGLGLSIVRSLARLMQGSAGIESEAGKGSRFWFRIPCGVVAPGEDGRHVSRAHAANDPSAPTRLTGRVLVVEDNRTNRKVAEAMLTRQGITVTVAEDGQQGFEAATRADRPDLVLMDLQMPVLDGYAATERIRLWERESGHPAVPIIALTADAFEEDRRRCEAVGMDDFLTKPISADALLAILRRWLNTGRGA